MTRHIDRRRAAWLAPIALIALVACGGGDGGAAEETVPERKTTEAPETTEAPATTEPAPTTTDNPQDEVELCTEGDIAAQTERRERVCENGEWTWRLKPTSTTQAPTTTVPPTTIPPPQPWDSPSRNDGILDTEEHAVILASDTTTPKLSPDVWDLFATNPSTYVEGALSTCERFREGVTRAQITMQVLGDEDPTPVTLATLGVAFRVTEYLCAADDSSIATMTLFPDAQYPFGSAPPVQEAATDPASAKGDGIYRVGENMAPGLWFSDGSGDDCYWKITPIGSTDITDNHLGAAGGSVTLAAGQQFETERCGNWLLQP